MKGSEQKKNTITDLEFLEDINNVIKKYQEQLSAPGDVKIYSQLKTFSKDTHQKIENEKKILTKCTNILGTFINNVKEKYQENSPAYFQKLTEVMNQIDSAVSVVPGGSTFLKTLKSVAKGVEKVTQEVSKNIKLTLEGTTDLAKGGVTVIKGAIQSGVGISKIAQGTIGNIKLAKEGIESIVENTTKLMSHTVNMVKQNVEKLKALTMRKSQEQMIS